MSQQNQYKRKIVKETVPSQYLPEGSRAVRIFLPPGYNELLSYPVVYCQDGEQFFNYGRIATAATEMILEDGIEPFIIVGVDVDIAKRTSEYSPDGALHERYATFFVEELVPFIEKNYAARSMREARIIAGDSLGGTVSLHIALKYPDHFNQIISLSGAFYAASTYMTSFEQDLSHLELYMIVGLQETAFETDRGTFNFVTINREMKQLLASKGAKLHYSEHDGEHLWGFWQKYVPTALKTFLHEE